MTKAFDKDGGAYWQSSDSSVVRSDDIWGIDYLGAQIRGYIYMYL